MSRMPISSGRYVPVIINGHRQWARDQVALQADILSLLERDGSLPKKRIIMALSTAQAAIETALNALLQTGKIERYRAMSVRRRMDEHWCVAGQEPATSRANFRAMEILAAFQQAAARRAGSMSA
jgi:predicted transcriptional regulator